MKKLIWLALLLPTFAFGDSAWTQADQELLEHVDEIDRRIITRVREVEKQFRRAFDRVFICGEFMYYGCTTATSSSTGLVLEIRDNAWRFGLERLIVRWRNPAGGSELFDAITIDGSTNALWLGGGANTIRTHPDRLLSPYLTSALVDDCDNPTIELVMVGEGRSRWLRANDGWIYEAESSTPIATVDVTGQTYGVINRRLADDQNQGPACTMVNDKVGFYDAYELTPLIDIAVHGTDWILQ